MFVAPSSKISNLKDKSPQVGHRLALVRYHLLKSMKNLLNLFKAGFVITCLFIFISCNQHKSDELIIDNKILSIQDTLSVITAYKNSLRVDNDSLNLIVWSEDARWLQAFGRVFHGRDTIINFTKYLHNVPGYSISKVGRQDEPEVIFIRPDVAILHEYHEREGQIINNVVTPTRRINTTYVMSKENGNWQIRDKVTMDVRERSKK